MEIILLITFAILFVAKFIVVTSTKKKIYSKIDNLLVSVSEVNEAVGKLSVKVTKNGDDLLKMKQERSAFKNELNSIQNTLTTLNNGFAIPSYKNT